MVQAAPVISDEARPDFHYQSPGVCDDGTHSARSPKMMRMLAGDPIRTRRRPSYARLFLRLDRLTGFTRRRALLLLTETHVCGEIFGFRLALRVRMRGNIVVHRIGQRFASLTRQRRNFEYRAVPAKAVAEGRDARFTLVFRHHVELVQ